LRGEEQIFQQLRLPAVPDLGAGAADVGVRQQVERRQAPLILHQCSKAADHVGVGEIALLRNL